MHARSHRAHAGVALAAGLLSSSCSANPIVCNDITALAPTRSLCADNGKDAKLRRDQLDARNSGFASALSHEGSFETQSNLREKKRDEYRFQSWHPLGSEATWIPGRIDVHRGTRAQPTLQRTSDRNIPEPSSLALLGIGLIAAAFALRWN